MIRIEIKFQYKTSVLYEETQAEAEAYVRALGEAGVVVVAVEYFDKDKREADIAAGFVGRVASGLVGVGGSAQPMPNQRDACVD